jgi:hypothetical protein
MPYEYDDIVKTQFQQLAAKRAQALAELEAGNANDDPQAIMDAGERVLEFDNKMRMLGRYQAQSQAQAARPAPNKYGLNDEEIDIARRSIVDSRVSDDEKQKVYSENKAKLRQMRATGQYSDRA